MSRAVIEDDSSEVKLAQVRERIRQNFPPARAALRWRKDTERRLVSECGRFAIEKTGDGDSARYVAKMQPHSVIGVRLYTAEAAKQICDRHASPLPLEVTHETPSA